MFDADKYFEQEGFKPWYSEALYAIAAVSGAATVAGVNYDQYGTKYIIITALIISFPAVVGAVVTFSDNFGRPIFAITIDPNSNGYYPVTRIIEGSILRVSANVAAGVQFTVEHQYVLINVSK